jgi:capsular exopolysaccharide synthesis family protein
MGIMSESLALILWRSRWIVLATTVAALTAALIYVIKATPIYTSTSRIYVEQSGPKIFTETQEGIMTQSNNYLYTQAELLTSTPILAAVLETPGLPKMQTFSQVDNHISYLKKNIVATVGKKDDIISVSFDSAFRAEAAQVVNAVVDAYITYHATRKRSTSGEVLKILQAEKTKRGAELTAKLKATVDFKNDYPAVALEGSQGNVSVEELRRLSELLIQARLTTIESESVYESTKGMISDPVKLQQFIEAQRARGVYITGDNERTELRSKLDQLEDQLADCLRQLTQGHPAVTALKTQIANVKAQITNLDEQFAQAQLAVAQQQYLAAKQKQDLIVGYYEQQRQDAIELNQQLAQYQLLESEYEQTKKLSDILDDRIKELNVTEDVGALNISILEYARPADKPSEPRKSRYMAIALVMGLMLGGGIGLLRDFMDQTLRSAEEISAVLGMPVLGVVPSMSRRESVSARGQKTHLDSKSQWAEAYRTIRTAVFFGAPKNEAKTILITSPTPADGKTTLASNLGIAMAQAGQRVLIVDADFRKPMQHRIFQLNHQNVGLSSILAGVSTVEKAIQRTDVNGLDLLACGPNVPNPAEILNSEAFAALLKLFTEKYDRIVLDSPPVMPVTDAQILGALCNVTLLVLRAEKSTRKASQQARHGLLSVGARVLGVIVNDVPKKGHYGYYGSYGYSYYGDGHRTDKRGGGKSLADPVKSPVRDTA